MYNIVFNSEKDIFLTNEMYANEAYLAILVMMQAIRAYSLDFVTTSSFANLMWDYMWSFSASTTRWLKKQPAIDGWKFSVEVELVSSIIRLNGPIWDYLVI